MKFSLILIASHIEQIRPAFLSLKTLRWPAEDLEVIVALGKNPSAQRNEAAKMAQSEFLLFLDDDSQVDSRLIHYYEDALSYDDAIGVVGGPSLYEGDGSEISTAIQCIFTSVFGLGPFRSRYVPLGRVRETTESELILCNLLIRRDLFLEEKGFNHELYPNEENEFLNRVQRRTKIYYHPLAICHRRIEGGVHAFLKQILRYGMGRAKNLALFPEWWNHIFIAPLLFSLYVVALPALPLLSSSERWYMASPVLVYGALNLMSSLLIAISRRNLGLALILPGLFLACHCFYGFGLLLGFLFYPFQKKRPVGDIHVLRVKAFNEGWQNKDIPNRKAA